MLEVRCRKRFPGGERIEVDFCSGGGVTALCGRSGSGKTSVLNMVAGVLAPDEGRIVVGDVVLFDRARGINLAPERRHCGYLFQDGRLFPHMSVLQNLRYGETASAEARGLPSFDEVLALLGVEHLLARRPSTLSGGEAQRVAIGRCLLSGARFFLMDEPTTFLDEGTREEFLALVERLCRDLSLPILYVTHDRRELERLGAWIVEMGEPTR